MTNNNYFTNKVGIITGAAGFIGSHLTDKLLGLGSRIIGIDNCLTGKKKNLHSALKQTNFTFYQTDIIPEHTLIPLLDKVRSTHGQIDFMAHLASPASPPLYQRYPCETYLVNSLATHNLLSWLKSQAPSARFLFASTSEVYGDPLVHPQKEDYWGNVNPNGVRSCYDESKRMGETIGGVFYRDFGLDVRIMRIFNTYGPRMDLQDGRILPQFIQQALAGEKLTIYGDGSQTRSYCYVDDLVAGIVSYLSAPALAGATLNLGNPVEFSVKQTAKIFNQLLGRSTNEIEYLPLPADDPKKRQPDISKAKKLLGFTPQVSFKQGLAQMLASYQLIK